MAIATGRGSIEVVKQIGSIRIGLVNTDQPWQLELDALVLSVGAGLGSLARATAAALPTLPWDEIDLDAISPGSPYVLLNSTGTRPKMFVLASAHQLDSERSVTVQSAADATADALRSAAASGAVSVGLPLVGAGMLDLGTRQVAEAIYHRVVPTLGDLQESTIRDVVLFDHMATTVDLIRDVVAEGGRFEQVRTEPPAEVASDARAKIDPDLFSEGRVTASRAEWQSLSPAVREAVEWAAACEVKSRNVGTRALLIGITRAENGRSPAHDLLTFFNISLPKLYDSLRRGGGSFTINPLIPGKIDLHDLPQLTGNAQRCLTRAATLRDESGRRELDLACLFGGLLSSSGTAQNGLERLIGVETLSRINQGYPGWLGQDQRPFGEFLNAWFIENGQRVDLRNQRGPSSDDDPGITLSEAKTANAQPVSDAETEATVPNSSTSLETSQDLDSALSEDAVPAEAHIPISEDSLGLDTYVTMLAAAIAREDTPLPLSIGLFGEWGSGKSYFMGLLRGQIEAFQTSENRAYLTNIEQITFNAWHYTDANLWASLASTIFERLGRDTPSVASRREDLVKQLGDDRSQVLVVQEEAERAQLEEADLEAELRRRRTELVGSGAVLLTAVQRSETVRGIARKAWQALGVTSVVEQEQLLSREARGLDADWFALRRAARGRRGAVLTTVVTISLLLWSVAAFVPATLRQWLAGGSSVALLAALATGLAFLRRARSAVRQISSAVAQTQAAALEVADEQLGPLHARVDIATKRATKLSAAHDELAAEINRVESQLSVLDPSSRWYDFVAERASSSDYQGHLGLISIIRRDFEQLISLMKDWRDNPGTDNPENRPINRIVLYIDDLDRCSPKQVMDVLQAVHLILALDLFVVVVGVDPRWLLKSLRQQYRDNFYGGGVAAGKDDDNDGWTAEPLDYLEKIFNIPFVLPRMTADSFRTFIEKVSSDSDRRAARASGGGTAIAVASDAQPQGHMGSSAPVSGATPGHPDQAVELTDPTNLLPPVTAEGGSEVAEALLGKPQPGIGLTPPELRLLSALGPVVESPREAKRLLNVYRMLRSLRAVGSATDFLNRAGGGGDYQALGILLGVLSAQPTLLGKLLWAPPTAGSPGGLCRRSAIGTWVNAADGLWPRMDTSENWCNDLGVLSAGDRADWDEILHRLSGATSLVTLADLSPFQLWGPFVARFSFVLSPLAATYTSDPPGLPQASPDLS